jgi:hypothetical protein
MHRTSQPGTCRHDWGITMASRLDRGCYDHIFRPWARPPVGTPRTVESAYAPMPVLTGFGRNTRGEQRWGEGARDYGRGLE